MAQMRSSHSTPGSPSSTMPMAMSTIPANISFLSRKCQYRVGLWTPQAPATRRIVRADRPSTRITSIAWTMIASRLRLGVGTLLRRLATMARR